MEVEAKFSIPDEHTLALLLEVATLAGYVLGPVSRTDLCDRYLDTANGAFFTAGCAFRLRHEKERIVVTLKEVGHSEGGVFRRDEHEIALPAPLAPEEWPAGPVRDMVLELRGDKTLHTLFEIRQQRLSRKIRDGERLIADLSCDRVLVCMPSDNDTPFQGAAGPAKAHRSVPVFTVPDDRKQDRRTDSFLELEIELLPNGTEADLGQIVEELRTKWKLGPAPESKFHRALAHIYGGDLGAIDLDSAPRLTAKERDCLLRLAAERPVLSRRAKLLLAWDEGASLPEMLARSGLSERRARYWRWAFRKDRLGIFPPAIMRSMPGPEEPRTGGMAGTAVLTAPVASPEPLQPASGTAPTSGGSKSTGISANDPMGDAGRKVLGFHFQRMLLSEPGTREATDIEALHDMRVATRRMRAAFRVFGSYYDQKAVGPFLKALRRTGRALGEVRDLDVFEQKTKAYRETLPETLQCGLDAFIAELQMQRDEARRRLISYLDSAAFMRFVTGFGEFVEPNKESRAGSSPGGERPGPSLVRHVAPVAIMERLAAVRAFEGWVEAQDVPLDRYHALRIAVKRLRYVMEFFSDILAPEGRVLVAKAVALQDHLGLLQDGVIASGLLRDFLMWGTWGTRLGGKKPHSRADSLIAPGVALYLAARQTEVQELVASFPTIWSTLTAPEYRRGVAVAVAAL